MSMSNSDARKRQTERTELAADGGEREALGRLLLGLKMGASSIEEVVDVLLSRTRTEGVSDAAFDEAGHMCPNCVTPWKCNGPHLDEQTPAALSAPVPDDAEGGTRRADCEAPPVSVAAERVAAIKAEHGEFIAQAIQAARPPHMTRDYTPVDQAYDNAARIARAAALTTEAEGSET